MTPADLIKVRPLADKLIASCNASEYWDELESLSMSECEALDSIAFECTCCNQWWDAADRNEVNGQWVCEDCDTA